ncbi:MAG: chemotaxis protein CheD [Candidatus Nanohalobium sp.]
MGRNKNVNMGEYKIGTGKEVLTAMGLGSCVATCLYDPEDKRAGLAHVMLPEEEEGDSSKHADILINSLIDDLNDKGSDTSDLEARIYGGASMFDNSFDIGKRNVESVEEILSRKGIPIREEDTGGEKGRAIWFNSGTGNVVVRKSFEGNKEHR